MQTYHNAYLCRIMYLHTRKPDSHPGFDGVKIKFVCFIYFYFSELLVVPPGFSSGMQFEKKRLDSLLTGTGDMSRLNLTDILATADDIDFLDDDADDDVINVKKDQHEDKETHRETQVIDCYLV